MEKTILLVTMVSRKDFMFFFWDEIKELFINSSHTALEKKELSISQRQAIIKLIEKKTEIKDL